MAINYNPPAYTDNPDVPRDLIDLISQLGDEVLSQQDKTDLMDKIQSGITQSNDYTDFVINNSGIPVLKQLFEHTSTDFITTQVLNVTLGATTTIVLDSITPIDLISLDDRLSDAIGTQAIVSTINDDGTVTCLTTNKFEIVSYGTVGAVNFWDVYDDVPPADDVPPTTPYYALSIKADSTNQVNLYTWNGTTWELDSALDIYLMSLFELDKDNSSQYWITDRWETADFSFDTNNYYTKAESDEIDNNQNIEINKREYSLNPGTGISIDRTNPEGPVISSTVAGGSSSGLPTYSTTGSGNSYLIDTGKAYSTLPDGFTFVMIPHVNSSSTTVQVKIDNCSASWIKVYSLNRTYEDTYPSSFSFMNAGKPVILMYSQYDGAFILVNSNKVSYDEIVETPTIMQGTGTSTSALMSQDAITKAIKLKNVALDMDTTQYGASFSLGNYNIDSIVSIALRFDYLNLPITLTRSWQEDGAATFIGMIYDYTSNTVSNIVGAYDESINSIIMLDPNNSFDFSGLRPVAQLYYT